MRVLQFKDLASHIDGDLLRQVAVCDRCRHVGDVSHLAVRLPAIEVDVVGEILPHAADAFHFRLTTQFAFGADFACNASHLGRERIELVHHRVDACLSVRESRRGR